MLPGSTHTTDLNENKGKMSHNEEKRRKGTRAKGGRRAEIEIEAPSARLRFGEPTAAGSRLRDVRIVNETLNDTLAIEKGRGVEGAHRGVVGLVESDVHVIVEVLRGRRRGIYQSSKWRKARGHPRGASKGAELRVRRRKRKESVYPNESAYEPKGENVTVHKVDGGFLRISPKI